MRRQPPARTASPTSRAGTRASFRVLGAFTPDQTRPKRCQPSSLPIAPQATSTRAEAPGLYDVAMDRAIAIALYERYAGSVAAVEVRTSDGDLSMGSAFHIGEGLYATARHVAQNEIVSMQTTQ